MSELIRVKREDIPKNWDIESRTHIRDIRYFEGEVVDTYSVTEFWVEFPKSGWTVSYHPEHLVIEASNIDHVSELRANDISYQSL